jgi:digeranylgeranylglycerophospholipid reductase
MLLDQDRGRCQDAQRVHGMSRDGAYDVLVVGLGPAGACAAAAAARAGAHVLAIDRRAVPGAPVQCAEFIPAMIGQEVAAVHAAWRQGIGSMTTWVEGAGPHVKPEFPGHMIDRAAFDAALVAEAEVRGVDCRLGVVLRRLDSDGTAIISPARGEELGIRERRGGIVRARVVIGADGPRSVVGRAIGRINRELAETRQITVPLRSPFEATDIYLSASIPGGYAWLFPKRDVANLGLGIEPAARHRLKPLLHALHRRLIAEGRVSAAIFAHTGGAIPVGGMLDPAGRLRDTTVLLAGDAAGLTNPVTGAGINAAVISGRLAGEAAARIAQGDAVARDDFVEELGDLFGASLGRALARRRELLQIYADRGPCAADLERAWIAFPAYWAA